MARKSHFAASHAFDLESVRAGFHGAVMKRAEEPVAKITLLVVDDHAMVRMGLRAMLALEPDFEVIAEAVVRYRE